MMNPPITNITSSAADPNVFARTISRAIAAINRKRPNAIWCTEKSNNTKRENLKHLTEVTSTEKYKHKERHLL